MPPKQPGSIFLAVELLIAGVESATSSVFLAEVVDTILDCPAILSDAGEQFARALLRRADERRDDSTASLAATALDGATRLAIGDWASRFLLLDTLTRISANESDLFATPAAPLVGVCYEQWRIPELPAVLEHLLTVPVLKATLHMSWECSHFSMRLTVATRTRS